MVEPIIDQLMLDPAIEIERFSTFDHQTRRFIAYALQQVPATAKRTEEDISIGGNVPLPFKVSVAEQTERDAAYALLPIVRGCTAKGRKGQRQRRAHFGDLLTIAKVDLRWKRLIAMPQFIFCYERLAGPAWRQLLPTCWREAVFQRREQGATQLPLDHWLMEDRTVPHCLENDAEPQFYPSMADADAFGAPLLTGL